MSDIVAEVIRNGRTESIHRGHIAVVTSEGRLLAHLGDAQTQTYIRSAAKAFQVMPLITTGAAEHFGFSDKELAVMMASHNGEPFHLQAVQSILQKIGLSEKHLRCGSHEPMHKPTATRLLLDKVEVTSLHNNCSGKHSGMLATAVYQKWPLETYLNPDHPLQMQVKETLARFSGLSGAEIGVGVDGCSAPVFFLAVLNMALMYARLAEGVIAPGKLVFDLMSQNPQMIAGTGRFDTDFMAALAGRAVSKIGAEGIRCVGIRGDRPIGVALKIEDGGRRASAAVLLAVLAQLELISQQELDDLARYSSPVLRNHAGIETGCIQVKFALDLTML